MISDNHLNRRFEVSTLLSYCEQKTRKNKKSGAELQLSYAGLARYRAALMAHMEEHNLRLKDEDLIAMSHYFTGVKKRCAIQKQNGERDMQEGKIYMPYGLYEELCKKFWGDGDLFLLGYLILSWNLGCRTNNTEGIKMGHLSWMQDALHIQFGVTKKNNEGESPENRLLMSNSDRPWMCPVLALGLLLCTLSNEKCSSDKLFSGGNQADRFTKGLAKALRSAEMEPYLVFHGLEKDDLGSHSIRKGAGTYLSNGSTAGPSYTSICIRMSWSLGNTKERYLFYNMASDAYCGRILAGLDQHSTRFALLPPHTLSPLSSELTAAVFPCTNKLRALETVRQFAFCSLLFHADYIKSTLSPHHPLFANYLFRNLSELKENITIVSGVSSPVLSGTGLPPHVLTWRNQMDVKSYMEGIPNKLLEGVGDVLRREGVAAGNITKEVMEEMMQRLLERDRIARVQTPAEAERTSEKEVDWPLHQWKDNTFHRLPEDFLFSDYNVLQCWIQWWHGDKERGIPPFCFLTSIDVPPKERNRYSNYKCMMKLIQSNISGLTPSDYRDLDVTALTEACHRGLEQLPTKPRKYNVRRSDWMVATALKDVRAARVEENPNLKRIQRHPVTVVERRKRAKRHHCNKD
tara:strand:+ start:587 stop:2482 length:1896 start_codon:yes stop_codon:yes gene_type:complete